jgi:hypothetical protein
MADRPDLLEERAIQAAERIVRGVPRAEPGGYTSRLEATRFVLHPARRSPSWTAG